MSDKIQIHMLGEFTISYHGRTISDQTNRSKKVWTLLEYLVAFHNKEISQFTLIDLLWPDEGNEDPVNSLKTLLHRTRRLLDDLQYNDHKLLLHRRDTYAWNNTIPYEIDVEVFEELCGQVTNLSLSKEERLHLCSKAFSLYKGEFLPKSTHESWALSLATHYQSVYTKLIYEYVELLMEDQQYDEIIGICSTASAFDPYDEQLHFLLINALHLAGRQKQALHKYENVMSLFYDKFGITPSQNLTDLYQTIVKKENATETDLSIIQRELKENESPHTAYQCDYSVFQNLYRIEARSASRSGLSIYLCLITIEAVSRRDTSELIGKAMIRMSDTIASSLRSGDVFARYSINQYIVMLPSTSYENCTMIGERILKRFDAERPRLGVTVSYSLRNLEPAEFARTLSN